MKVSELRWKPSPWLILEHDHGRQERTKKLLIWKEHPKQNGNDGDGGGGRDFQMLTGFQARGTPLAHGFFPVNQVKVFTPNARKRRKIDIKLKRRTKGKELVPNRGFSLCSLCPRRSRFSLPSSTISTHNPRERWHFLHFGLSTFQI